MSHVLRHSSGAGLRLPVTLSALVHVGLVALAIVAARGGRQRGEVYTVNLIAAAAGPRASRW